MKKIFLVPFLLLLSAFVVPLMTPRALALQTGVVCVAAQGTSTSGCPTSPPTFVSAFGSNLVVAINIQGSDSMNGFRIFVKTDNTILNPVSADLGNTLLASPVLTLANCVNGAGTGCSLSSGDGPGVVDMGAVSLASLTIPPTTGGLFEITYHVVGNTTTATSPIGFVPGCAGSSVPGYCITITNGGTTPDPETIQTGSFATPLQASVSTSTSLIFVNNPATFNSVVTGGVSPYTYAWDVLCDGTVDGTGASLTFTFAGRGSFAVCLTVTDSTAHSVKVTGSFTVWVTPKFAAMKWDDGTKAMFVKYKVLASFSPPLTTDIFIHITIFNAATGMQAGSLDGTFLAQPQRTGIIKEIPWTACSPTVTTNCFTPGVAYNATGTLTFKTLDTSGTDGTRTTSFVPT